MHCNNIQLATSTVEIYTVVRIDLFTYLLKSRDVILFWLSTTCLACGIGMPDRMTKPRTKNGLLASLMSEAREQFLGMAEGTL